MVEKEKLTLENAAVQAAQARWDASGQHRRYVKHGLTFQDWLAYFQAHGNRTNPLGGYAGVSRERVRQIYEKYFRDVFEGKSGRELQRDATVERKHEERKKREDQVFSHGVLARVVAKARAAGCEVAGVRYASEHWTEVRMKKGELLVNGKRCSVRRVTSGRNLGGGKRFYACASLIYNVLLVVDAVIFVITVEDFPERIFIVPNTVLQEAFLRNAVLKAKKCIYFPLEQLPSYRGIHPRIDYWEYEDAWDILRPK